MPTTYAIPNGRTAFDATTYTSNGTTQTVSNADLGTVGFKPDLLWIKNRSITQNHYLSDSNRGAASILSSNSTAAANSSPNFVTSFNTNGFSFGVDNTANGNSMVAWQWVAGQGVNNTNNAGTITTTVSVNTTTGFSIIKYTGNNTAGATIGHGLGAAPKLVIARRYNATLDWVTWHGSIPASQYLYLNTTAAAATDNTYWNSTAPTSTVISLGTDSGVNGSAYNIICYAWAPVAGFSQFGSYTGNASTDGPFIYLGFRPKFLLIKNTQNGATDWTMLDSSRNTYNVANLELNADLSGAEYTGNAIDFLSNGFKIRTTFGNTNGSGQAMIYAAFAENPFKYANAR